MDTFMEKNQATCYYRGFPEHYPPSHLDLHLKQPVQNMSKQLATLNQMSFMAFKELRNKQIKYLGQFYCICPFEGRPWLQKCQPHPTPIHISDTFPFQNSEIKKKAIMSYTVGKTQSDPIYISSDSEEERKPYEQRDVRITQLKTRNVIQNQTSQTNIQNLQALEGYPYSSAVQPNSKNGKMVMVYKCEFNGCHKTFMRTWNLLDHIRMHYGIRPYVCKFCGKGFTQKGNMRKHLIQHEKPHLSNRKKFKCEFCSSSFTERYNYRTHVEKKHGISSKF
ncbi:unnamed protein product [Moneuplotes crassus]|uniref:C2H2-type domain-containing protein n=1 Tax=Euplotes crassus TaxID=5936 RepID=A0AAD1XE24_EUPCR|nr:unnamed protein product [Moneuplotes crassus]